MSFRGAPAMARVRLRCRMVEEISKGKPYHCLLELSTFLSFGDSNSTSTSDGC